MEPEAPFGEGTQSIPEPKRGYFKKLAISFGIVSLIAAVVAGVIAAIIGAHYVGTRIGGHGGGTIGACVMVVILFCFAIASSDWDSEDGF